MKDKTLIFINCKQRLYEFITIRINNYNEYKSYISQFEYKSVF